MLFAVDLPQHSSATVGMQRVTRTPAYLFKPEDWIPWLFQYQDTANAANVWIHCDPSKPHVPLEDEPARPARPAAGATPEDIKLYTLDRADWEHDYRIWKRKEDTLKSILTDIPTTISKNHLPLIKNHHTVWGRLHALSEHLAPSDPTRKHELRRQYEDVRNPRRSHNQSFESWLDDWLRITDLMIDLSMPEMTEGQPNEHFLNAVMTINESWATQKLLQLLSDQQDPIKAQSLQPISSLIAEFKQFQRVISSRKTHNGAFSATLGIAANQDLNQNQLQNQHSNSTNNHSGYRSKSPRKPHSVCYCGVLHWYSECPYLITHKRPAGWREDRAIIEKFKEARKDPVIKARLESNQATNSHQINH